MKTIKIFTFIAAAVILTTGCSKDYVETETPDRFTDDNFWTSESNVRTYSWNFYDMFVGFGTGTSGNFYFSNFSDDQAATGFINFPTSAAATSGAWDFSHVRRANLLLERVDRVTMTDEAKNHWKGVARFFRAFQYFELVKDFGGVPWISKVVDISETGTIYKPRDSRVLVMDSVLADLNFAISNLRAVDQPNTVNKDVARALLSRVGLFEGTFRKYHTTLNLPDADKFLQASKTASEQLMTGTYVLTPTYGPVYNSMDLSGNKEVILHRRYIAGAVTHSVIGYTNSSTQMHGLTKDAVESYVATDGLPITLSPLYQGDATITTVRANRDQRLLNTVGPVLVYNGSLVDGLSSSTGYRPIKFLQPASTQLAPNNETDAPVFWLAEVLLNYAEAAAELDHMGKYVFVQADLDKSVNRLRTRAGVAPLQSPGGQNVAVNGVPFVDPAKDADVTPLIWEIRRERRVELMMDGFRYDDLMRWKKGGYLDKSMNPDAFLGAKVPDNGVVRRDANGYIMPYTAATTRTFIDPKHYLSAIPTGQIALYPNGELQQNPGW